MRSDPTRSALRSPFPWMALSAALMLTALGWFGVERARHEQARNQFERRTETATAAIRARMVAYEQVLRAGAAYMASSPTVSREDWRRFIAHLDLDERFPGIQSVGFAEVVRPATRMEHVLRMRAEGFADYDIRPPGTREEMAPIVYNEPFTGRNTRVIGFDVASDPLRRQALDLARDTGEVAITGRLTLAGEAFRGNPAQQPGFVMMAPVHMESLRDLPRRDRRNAITGFVVAPFRMNELMRGILDEGALLVLDMRIYDEAEGQRQQELIDTRLGRPSTALAPTFERIVHFPMPARNWTIRFASRPEFDAELSADKPWVLLAGGILGATVVFLLTTALVEAWTQAHNLSMRDPLTGLFNRRYVEETMAREVPRALRNGHSVGLIVLDLDHFKKLNDTHGHDAGDFVLARVGELLRNATRGGDIACRFGGEEFGVILPGATQEVSAARADAIRAAFGSMQFDFEGNPLGSFTLSAGVAALSPAQPDWSVAMREADRALYAAKREGRNRVKSSRELPPEA